MPSEANIPSMRAAIYARYSTDLQNPASIEDQIRVCRAEIERRGGEVVAVYKDAAISGASALRPGYQSLLQDARDGRFDVVVAEALDRLSRLRRIVEAIAEGVPARTLKEELLALEAGRTSSRPSSPPRPRRSSRCSIPTWPRSTGARWRRCRRPLRTRRWRTRPSS